MKKFKKIARFYHSFELVLVLRYYCGDDCDILFVRHFTSNDTAILPCIGVGEVKVVCRGSLYDLYLSEK